MLLVRDSMVREVVTVSPETTAAEALKLCWERGIRHLPVLEGGKMVGLISDRDLRLATPALGDPNRAAALEKIRVGDEMSRGITTADPEDPIEQAAMAMHEKKIGCLPVVEGDDLVGILTASDVMAALVRLVGAHEPGSRLEVQIPDRPGSLAEVAGIVRDQGVNIVSVLSAPSEGNGVAHSVAVIRLATINPSGVVRSLQEAGFPVLWPPTAPDGPGL
ncbi:CBS domain-containing protein [Rubrobacter marinus]|uniref:CBS domain-containing protein n=1 Tax=Rubrobacter marinus TaxID=2653852 RepID=A0A6G8PYR1_9ACTN|nr:CBS and ACT domain-containing protein [Rubrobacter marinus]QIN79353.1 CBS domain-containing protein [Rubrobacter marinus]